MELIICNVTLFERMGIYICIWASALVTKTGDVLHNFWTDSHEDLIAIFGMKDDGKARFCRIEFSPADPSKAHLLETYALKIDETDIPIWFDDDMRTSVIEKMTALIKRCIRGGAIKMLCGDVYILSPDAAVNAVKNARIVSMSGSSNVVSMSGSSKVGSMSGSSKVGSMYDSSNVGSMYGSSKVGSMYDSSNVGSMSGSSNVGSMYGSSKVVSMSDSSNVVSMSGSSNVGSMSDSSKAPQKPTTDKRV